MARCRPRRRRLRSAAVDYLFFNAPPSVEVYTLRLHGARPGEEEEKPAAVEEKKEEEAKPAEASPAKEAPVEEKKEE